MKTLVSAHNCIFGPRHLGIYASTFRHWPDLQQEYECFFVVDDLVGHFTQPIDANTYPEKAQLVAAQMIQAGVNPAKSHMVLVSEIPEVFELAFLLGSAVDAGLLLEIFRTSIFGQLSIGQRAQWGLPARVTFGEIVYPHVVISAYVLGLGADVWQGGLETSSNHSAMTFIANDFNRRTRQRAISIPRLLYGEPRSVLGYDGKHMSYANRLEVQALPENIGRQVEAITKKDVMSSWYRAVGMNAEASRISRAKVISNEDRRSLMNALEQKLSCFREKRVTNQDVINALARGTAVARERLQKAVTTFRNQLMVKSYLRRATTQGIVGEGR